MGFETSFEYFVFVLKKHIIMCFSVQDDTDPLQDRRVPSVCVLGCVLDPNYMDFWFTFGFLTDSCSRW